MFCNSHNTEQNIKSIMSSSQKELQDKIESQKDVFLEAEKKRY